MGDGRGEGEGCSGVQLLELVVPGALSVARLELVVPGLACGRARSLCCGDSASAVLHSGVLTWDGLKTVAAFGPYSA